MIEEIKEQWKHDFKDSLREEVREEILQELKESATSGDYWILILKKSGKKIDNDQFTDLKTDNDTYSLGDGLNTLFVVKVNEVEYIYSSTIKLNNSFNLIDWLKGLFNRKAVK
jgi:hypothetical protein